MADLTDSGLASGSVRQIYRVISLMSDVAGLAGRLGREPRPAGEACDRVSVLASLCAIGYDVGDPAGNGSGNSRNGHGSKSVLTTGGPVSLDVPRDYNGSFEAVIVPKSKRRLGQVEDMILSLYRPRHVDP